MYSKRFSSILISTAYLPNIQYVSKIIGAEQVIMEANEYYLKQSFRNRCEILSSNGVLSLTIPVERNHGSKIQIRDVKIDYQENWQQLHWRAIEAAYRSSPFFEYYIDDLIIFYRKPIEYLFDFNIQMLTKIFELIGLPIDVIYTTHYQMSVQEYDYRNSISPKARLQQPDPYFELEPYYQVFGSKYNFYPNLSVLDLLCNEGNNSLAILLNSIK